MSELPPEFSDLPRAQALVDEGRRRQMAGALDEAEAAFVAAADAAPRAALPVHSLGVVRHLRGDLAGAERAFRRALELEPGRAVSRAALGAVLLAQSRFGEGFPLYDAWRETDERRGAAAPGLPFPLWRGGDPAGRRILVWGEEGFGDQIMFARFAAILQARGAQLAWVAPPPLARLLHEGLGVSVIAGAGRISTQDFDAYCPSSALPVAFAGELDPPPAAPYLKAPPPNRIAGLTIGLAARGNPKHPFDARRSLSDAAAAELLALPGVVSLAPEDTGARDFNDTAGIVAGLDLVISVDTAVAHLAGALGRPVWVLNYEPAGDWRWLQERTDSPWYPSARVFRQPAPGDWAGVVAQVKAALAERGSSDG